MLSFASHSLLLLLLLSFYTMPISSSSLTHLNPPEDALALLAFKSEADSNNKILHDYSLTATLRFCQWQGVKCTTPTTTSPPKVIKFILQNQPLSGVFANNTVSRLDQLRVLILRNVSLTGPIPHDLFKLDNLKSLLLDHNYFSGSLPPSLSSLHRLRSLVVSFNNLTGPVPPSVSSLNRLSYLGLEFNRFNGSLPPLNQSSLSSFNVSHNNLSGPIPVTVALLRFTVASFVSNPNLCGKIIQKECRPGPPFFNSSLNSPAPPPTTVLGQSAEVHGVNLTKPDSNTKSKQRKKKKTALIIGFSSATAILIGSVFCLILTGKRRRDNEDTKSNSNSDGNNRKQHPTVAIESNRDGRVNVEETGAAAQVMQQERELEEKVKRMARMHNTNMGMKSGSLLFCAGEAQLYTIDQLMRASAELLGRGSVGTTYKAVLDNRLIVCVKRLDSGRIGEGVGKEGFERHMGAVGGLRHPNLVPLRAYFQAREERLLIYDYQPNGSLFSLIHG